jgi:demethylmenaquinone methyltransferase/2-methoxy-6-polyprenyl-1,4-benzoquinol methylase
MSNTPHPILGENGATTHFGDRTVPTADKARLVRGVFEGVAARYDLMNDLMSGGIHRLWKDSLVAEIRPRAGESVLDVAGGTGDVALRLLDAAGGKAAGASVTVCDLTPAMLARGRDRAIDAGVLEGLRFVAGDAERLPLAPMSVDTYVIAFGLRNVARPEAALAEAARVLRPGGRFFCLEFSHVVVPGLDRLYDLYADAVLPWLGRTVAADEPAYRYLVESIRRFPPQAELAAMMERAGLARPRWRNLSGGIAAIHSAWRI